MKYHTLSTYQHFTAYPSIKMHYQPVYYITHIAMECRLGICISMYPARIHTKIRLFPTAMQIACPSALHHPIPVQSIPSKPHLFSNDPSCTISHYCSPLYIVSRFSAHYCPPLAIRSFKNSSIVIVAPLGQKRSQRSHDSTSLSPAYKLLSPF